MALITNLYSALAQGTLWGIMALGVYITFRILDIADLSCDGTFALGGCISAILITRGVNPFVTLLFALAGGMLAGLVTGWLHTKLMIPAILAGILTLHYGLLISELWEDQMFHYLEKTLHLQR